MASILGGTHRREHRDRRGMWDRINRIFRIIQFILLSCPTPGFLFATSAARK